jgi:hypothetical protein
MARYRASHCVSHCLSLTVSHTVSLTLSLSHCCLSHCVCLRVPHCFSLAASLTVSSHAPSLPLCLPHRLSHCVFSRTVSISPCPPPSLSLRLSHCAPLTISRPAGAAAYVQGLPAAQLHASRRSGGSRGPAAAALQKSVPAAAHTVLGAVLAVPAAVRTRHPGAAHGPRRRCGHTPAERGRVPRAGSLGGGTCSKTDHCRTEPRVYRARSEAFCMRDRRCQFRILAASRAS